MNKNQISNNSGFISLIGLVILLVVAIIAAGSIYYVARPEKSVVTNVATINTNGSVNANINQNTNANVNSNAAANVSTNGNNNVNTNVNINTNLNTNTGSTVSANWKTYQSKQYGLTFKYPATWTVEEGELSSPYSVYAHGAEGSVRFWMDRPYDGISAPNGITSTSTDVTIAGRSAHRSETRLANGTLFFVTEKFYTQPTGWGADAAISITPSAAGSVVTQNAIVSTLTID